MEDLFLGLFESSHRVLHIEIVFNFTIKVIKFSGFFRSINAAKTNGFTNFPFPETENLFIRLFFISNIFISNGRLKLAKNQANAKQQPEAELLLFRNYSYSLSTLSSKNNKI